MYPHENLSLEDMKDEIWKQIKDYPKYMISNHGRVKSFQKIEPIILKPFITHKGYLRVTLSNKQNSKNFQIHRLVLIAFKDNPNNYPQCNHIDGDKKNNFVDNLEWCNNSKNIKHAYDNGLIKNIHRLGEHHNATKINQYTLDGKFIKTWGSIVEIAQYFGVHHDNISRCARGILKSSCGYQWKYYDDYSDCKNIEHIKPDKQRVKPKCIYQYDKKGNFIKAWNNTFEIENELGYYQQHIRKNCQYQCKSIYGYIWRYEDDIKENGFKFTSNKPRRKINRKYNHKIVYQYDMNNNLIKEWDSVKSICNEFNCYDTSIYRVIKGIRNSYHGYKFSYNYPSKDK